MHSTGFSIRNIRRRDDMDFLRTFGIAGGSRPGGGAAWGEEPQALNPFDDKPATLKGAVLGYVELSDGSIRPGWVYLTRDKRLQLVDDKTQQQHEVPLSAVKQIDCAVKKEWMEKEWRFKEATSNEKLYTGRAYPAREYTHTITFQNGRKVVGGLSGIVYLQPLEYTPGATLTERGRLALERYILNKRVKGEMGADLKSLVYVKRIKLGKDAYEEARASGEVKGLPLPEGEGDLESAICMNPVRNRISAKRES